MAYAVPTEMGSWTAVDLADRFGPIPLARIRHDPPPGTATEADVIEIHDRENRLCELVDGVLVEKTVGTYEAYLAGVLFEMLAPYVRQHKLGIVLPPDGILRLWPGQVRIPDVSFISWSRLPDPALLHEPIAPVVPDLAVEVISRGNTREEMSRKLRDYFQASVRQVWYIDPAAKQVRVYSAVDSSIVLHEHDTLEGGEALAGVLAQSARVLRRTATAGGLGCADPRKSSFSRVDLLPSPILARSTVQTLQSEETVG